MIPVGSSPPVTEAMARTGHDQSVPLEDIRGEDAESLVDMRRSWKPVLWIGVVTLLAFIVPLLVLPGTSARRADARAAELSATLAALNADMGPAQQALEVLTEPASSPDQFAALLPTIAGMRTDAEAVAEDAARGVPFAWPLASSEPFDELVPFVRDARGYAATASDLVEELVAVLNYRAAYAAVLAVGDLPPRAPERFDRFISEVGDLSDAQQQLLEELPRHPSLADHRSAVGDGVRRFESWTEEYIRALFIGDEASVTELFLELEVVQRELDIGLIRALAAIRSELDAVILQLADELAGAIAGLG